MSSQKKFKQTSAFKPVKNVAIEFFLSIDVECVATGCGHLDRTPVSIAVVDESEALLFDEKIDPGCAVHSYLTELTGFYADDFKNKRSLAEVMVDVRSLLGPNVVLVGQGIGNDIRWLQLVQGTDYKRFIDLAELFTTEHKAYGTVKKVVHGLQNVAKICLPDYEPASVHSAAVDALISIKLFKKAGGAVIKQKDMKALHHALRQAPRAPESVLARNNYRLGDVCCAGYSKTVCWCRQPNVKLVLAATEGEYPYPFPVVTSAQIEEMHPVVVDTSTQVPADAAPLGPVVVTPMAMPASHVEPREDYPRSYSTMRETMERGGGRFDPHENYDDDYDNLYGDFYGNSGGKD